MKVAIPTHLRQDSIGKKALNFVLNVLEIDPDDVYIFVSNDQQLEDYVAQIEARVRYVVANTTTSRDKFNFIHNFFEPGTDVLFVEDDVKGLVILGELTPKEIVQAGFATMHHQGKKIWGVYPAANKFFMKDRVEVGFVFIVANVFGFVSTRDARLEVQEQCKHDYERTILYHKYYGGVTRLNYCAAITTNYTNKGGMQSMENRAELENKSCLNLLRKYPDLVSLKNGSKSIYTEIKLKRL